MPEQREMRDGDPYATGDESVKALVHWLRSAIKGAEDAGMDTLMLAIPKTPVRVAELHALVEALAKVYILRSPRADGLENVWCGLCGGTVAASPGSVASMHNSGCLLLARVRALAAPPDTRAKP